MLPVIEPVTGAARAKHALVARGETSVIDDHYSWPCPTPRTAVHGDGGRSSGGSWAWAGLQSNSFGAAAARVIELGAPSSPRSNPGHGPLPAAANRCCPHWKTVAFGHWRADDVRSILDTGGPADPRRPAKR